ncbi:hypothetical protein BDF22DRAFT_58407 [Syncephalis plumigaleata]|nr:hypothetical protein BDF22DRAFT_58407 [Syncephalis plumigaleata]
MSTLDTRTSTHRVHDDDDDHDGNRLPCPQWIVSSSDLKIHTFRPATASRGVLKLSLTYDPTVGGLRDISRDKTLPKGVLRQVQSEHTSESSQGTITSNDEVSSSQSSWTSKEQASESTSNATITTTTTTTTSDGNKESSTTHAQLPLRPSTPTPSAELAVQLERLARLKLICMQRPQLTRSRLSFTHSAGDDEPSTTTTTTSNTSNTNEEKLSTDTKSVPDNADNTNDNASTANSSTPSNPGQLARSLSGLTRMLRGQDGNNHLTASASAASSSSLPIQLPSLPNSSSHMNVVDQQHQRGANLNSKDDSNDAYNKDALRIPGDDESVMATTYTIPEHTSSALPPSSSSSSSSYMPVPIRSRINDQHRQQHHHHQHHHLYQHQHESSLGKLISQPFRPATSMRPPAVTPTSPTLPSPLRNSFDALGNSGLSLPHMLRSHHSARSINRRASITGELFGSFIGSYEWSYVNTPLTTDRVYRADRCTRSW